MNSEMPPRITRAPMPIATALLPLNPLPPEVEAVELGATVGGVVV
jgi:hypothetical protein